MACERLTPPRNVYDLFGPPSFFEVQSGSHHLYALRSAISTLSNYVKGLEPRYLAFSGRSSLVSQAICTSVGILPGDSSYSVLKFPPELNESLYSTGYGRRGDDTKAHDILKLLFPEAQPTDRIVVIDEFLQSGKKAYDMVDRMQRIGYPNTFFAIFSGIKHADKHKENVFVASYDSILHDYLMSLAHLVSSVQINSQEVPDTYGLEQADVKTFANRALQQLVNALQG